MNVDELVKKFIKAEAERIQREAYAARPIYTDRDLLFWGVPDLTYHPRIVPAPWHVSEEFDKHAIEADGCHVL